MNGQCFEAIHAALTYTTNLPLGLIDPTNKFWEVTKMINAWNLNMDAIFMALWVSCFDKNTSIWFNQWT